MLFTENVITIAQIQSSLFEYACEKRECSSSFFIKQFLYSDVALRMSNENFVYSCEDVPFLYEQLKKEKKLAVGKEIYPEDVMGWIGYLFVVMVYNHKLYPSQIYRIIKPKELYIAYDAYHSLDIEDAASRILDSRMYKNKNDVELHRKIRKL